MTEAVRSFGLVFKMGDGEAVEAFTAIAELTDLQVFPINQETVDATHHASPNAFREFIPTLKDGGEVTGTVNWIPGDATHDPATGLLSLLLDGNAHNFEIDIPALVPVTWAFRGIVTQWAPGAGPIDGKLTADFIIKTTGEPALES